MRPLLAQLDRSCETQYYGPKKYNNTLFEYLIKTLETLRVQQEVFRDEDFLKAQSANALAVLHGVLANKVFRLLEALSKPHIPMLKENNVRTGFFKYHQFLAMQERLPAPLQPLVEFAYITSWRKSKIFSLKWHQLDFKAGYVHLDPGTTKNMEGRVFPLTDNLRALLERQK